MANIAFKVRYCNGSVENGHVGFQGICTDGLIRYYIFDRKQFPCSDSNCICYNYWRYSSKELESYFNISAPCYESNILRDWRIKAKTNISIPEELVNGLCVLTTSRPNLPDRLVFAIFLIKDVVANEIFAEFLIRVNAEIQCCKLAQFATLKALCAPNFAKFRSVFKANLKSLFVVPGNTFDNVNGQFPIGFAIWDTAEKRPTDTISIRSDVYDRNGNLCGTKLFFTPPEKRLWMDWVKTMHDKNGELIGHFRTTCSDFQNQNGTFITSQPSANDILQVRTHEITKSNFPLICIAFAVRMCIEPTWLNDRDQFLFPNDGWQSDREFQGDCLIYTLFHGQNRISCHAELVSASQGKEPPKQVRGDNVAANHWIPFTESQVGCKSAFKSTFMSDFIKDFLAGKIVVSTGSTTEDSGLFAQETALAVSNEPCGSFCKEIINTPLSRLANPCGNDGARPRMRIRHRICCGNRLRPREGCIPLRILRSRRFPLGTSHIRARCEFRMTGFQFKLNPSTLLVSLFGGTTTRKSAQIPTLRFMTFAAIFKGRKTVV